MTTTEFDPAQLGREYRDKAPQDIIRLALETFDNIAISFSGAEDVVLVDMAVKINPKVNVFSLDTGRLHPETYRFLELVRTHYHINIEVLSPDHATLEKFVREKGLYSFYKDGHQECCGIRKVMPLRKKLNTLDAWITGQRKDQSPGTRADVPVIEKDGAFSTDKHTLIKFNPLSFWSSSQVWQYIRANEVPFNELHNKGYISIGCEPCTRPVLPNQHEREGRWWWEEATMKECGLHSNNLKQQTG
jgi:phosphoadenosine phosphosulfate reductase